MRIVLPVVVAALVLTGCSGAESPDPPVESPTQTNRGEAPDDDVLPVEVPSEPTDPIEREDHAVDAVDIAPNPEIMATMECEPVSDEAIESVRRFGPGGVELTVQVLIGEGNQPGSRWWIVAGGAALTEVPGMREVWITDQPGLDHGHGTWIPGGSQYPVDGALRFDLELVDWDETRLERAQSAIAKAFDCLHT